MVVLSRVDLQVERSTHPVRVLVTGATGYIGGRLVPRLLARGHQVRCVARDPNRLAGRDWPHVEIVQGDLADASALPGGARGHRGRLLPRALDGRGWRISRA